MEKTNAALDLAPQNQGVKVVAVILCDPADVYCMRVPETGCFAVADGIIVANCYDETRYELMSPYLDVGILKLRGV